MVKGKRATNLQGIWEKPADYVGWLRSCLYPRAQQQTEVDVLHPLWERQVPRSMGPSAEGHESKDAKADRASYPLFPLGQEEAKRAQESKNPPAIGHPASCAEQSTPACLRSI